MGDYYIRFVDGTAYIITRAPGHSFLQAEVTPAVANHFWGEPGCTCRPVLGMEEHAVLVGGMDDCPVHGFCPGEG